AGVDIALAGWIDQLRRPRLRGRRCRWWNDLLWRDRISDAAPDPVPDAVPATSAIATALPTSAALTSRVTRALPRLDHHFAELCTQSALLRPSRNARDAARRDDRRRSGMRRDLAVRGNCGAASADRTEIDELNDARRL